MPPASKGSPKIAIEAVSKRFGHAGDLLTAVDAADFRVSTSEFVSIVGPSGCGKSTVLNIIAGLDEPSSGRILIDGAAVQDRRPYCGYMFQKDLLFAWRTIEGNVALGLEVEGLGHRESRARAR